MKSISNECYQILVNKLSENTSNIQKGSCYGLYQISQKQLTEIGYISQGMWSGKNEIWNLDDFLNNKTVQDIAIKEYLQLIWQKLSDYHSYEGRFIKEFELNEANMILVTYLLGEYELANFIESDGNSEYSNYVLSILEELKNAEDDIRLNQKISQLKEHIFTEINNIKTFTLALTKKSLDKTLSNIKAGLANKAKNKVIPDKTTKIDVLNEEIPFITPQNLNSIKYHDIPTLNHYRIRAGHISDQAWLEASCVIEGCDEYLAEAMNDLKNSRNHYDLAKVSENFSTFCEVISSVLGVSKAEITEIET